MLKLVNHPNDISLSRTNQSQAKFKSTVGGNLLQSWVNTTVVINVVRKPTLKEIGSGLQIFSFLVCNCYVQLNHLEKERPSVRPGANSWRLNI